MDESAHEPWSEEQPTPAKPSSEDEAQVIAEAHGLLSEIEADLAAIEEALGRIEQSSYGTCEVCGVPIEPARLAADQATRRCAAHDDVAPPTASL